MHIGVDVRNLTAPSITGIARVLVETTHAMAAQGVSFTFFWPGKRLASPLDTIQAAKHVESVFSGGAGPIIWGETALAPAVRRVAPDAFWGPAHRLPPFLAASVPSVVTIHDLVWRRFPQTMPFKRRIGDRVLMTLAIRRADCIVADSKATAHDIEDVFGKRQVSVVYPGVRAIDTTPDANARPAILGSSPAPYALFVGTLEPRKNLPRLLEAFSRARIEARADWRLVIAGGKGWHDAAIRDALAPLVADSSVILAGRLSDEELAALCAGARFLAMPSLYEGFGLPVIEAQQYGVPALAGRAGSLPEVTGAGGILVDPGDVGDIATGIARLFRDDEFHAALASQTRQNAARFTWDATAKGMIGMFEEVVERRRRQRSLSTSR